MRVRIFTMSVVLLFLSSSSFALIGPPTAELSKGQWNLSGNYTYTSQDLKNITGKDSNGNKGEHGVENFNINRYYGQLGYGLTDNWELYGQLGIADIKLDIIELAVDETIGYNFDNDLFYGLGTKYTFAKQAKIDWGAALQANLFSTSWSEKFIDEKETYDIDVFDITVAVGPTIDMGGWKLYGGALYGFISFDGDYKLQGTDFVYKSNGDSDTNNFGGYVGAQFNIQKKWNVKIEGLSTNNDGWGVGAGIEIPF